MLSLTTERLVLKPHTLDSLGWLHALVSDADECYYNNDDPPKSEPQSLEKTVEMLDRMLRHSLE